MKKLFILILIAAPLFAQSQSKSLEALIDRYKDLPNSFNMNFGGSFLGMSNWIMNEEDDKEVKELIKSINNMHLFTLPIGEGGVERKTLAKLRKDMGKESYEDLMAIRDGEDHINMLVKEKNGIISSLVMLIESQEELTILDFSGAIDMKNLALLANKVNIDAEID